MIMRWAADGGARIEEADVLTQLKVVLARPASEDATAGSSDELIAGMNHAHAWVVVAELRRRSGAGQAPGWGEAFDAMISYARSAGWTSDGGRLVRAHVERAPS
ncbi:hypothetical protein SAMN05660324_4140 [Klenkia brasiliensis]|uniref:Uncharacterized protein n=1 Tax=Klenkia brasiliensis TaxID=333142 RepID=A0A1G7Z661_9ACTN|nr:hypothetical protein SAMN05660324_4140 [Klenkia brasiliensis]